MSDEELYECIERAQKGDIESQNKIVVNYNNLVRSIVIRMINKKDNYHLEDLYQEGILGVIKSIDYYNKNNKTSFKTYTSFWIRCFILRYLHKNRIKHISNIQNRGYDFESFIIGEMMDEKNNKILYEALNKLEEIEQQVIKLRYGIDQMPYTYFLISETLRKPVGVIKGIEKAALKKLKELMGDDVILNDKRG